MNEHEFTLIDRVEVIKMTINKYGEDNFKLSFSGGKDSMVVHTLLDMALPNNQIPRVYVNTGIEYLEMVKFVKELSLKDKRIQIIPPQMNIKKTLETYGYPFKSKMHSTFINVFQNNNCEFTKSTDKYYHGKYKGGGALRPCPAILKYQFSKDFHLKLSDKCCFYMKEEPLKIYSNENNKPYSILGLMAEEGGRRESVKCVAFKGKKMSFSPLAKVTKEWEEWFIKEYNVQLCKLYYHPYNFERTGCKGCPFAYDLVNVLEVMAKYFPNERKQCEFIWKPVYDEYRRIGYRLSSVGENVRLF